MISKQNEDKFIKSTTLLKYGNVNDNIDCFFIEYKTESFDFDKQNVGTIKSICTESYIPGIYQK